MKGQVGGSVSVVFIKDSSTDTHKWTQHSQSTVVPQENSSSLKMTQFFILQFHRLLEEPVILLTELFGHDSSLSRPAAA